MKNLEEIYLNKTSTHIERASDGTTRQVSREFKHKYKVKTVNQKHRITYYILDLLIIVFIVRWIINIAFTLPFPMNVALVVFAFLVAPLYYTFTEFYLQKTLGKHALGYVVIDIYGQKPSFWVCLKRAMIRYLPFQSFSCMTSPSRGWQDKWTDTYVVHEDELIKIKNVLMTANQNNDA